MKYKLLYFAILADQAGCSDEIVESECCDAFSLYLQLREKYSFTLSPQRLRVAINGEVSHWNHVLTEKDEIAFLPPVSGG